jgi:hypothetical protein
VLGPSDPLPGLLLATTLQAGSAIPILLSGVATLDCPRFFFAPASFAIQELAQHLSCIHPGPSQRDSMSRRRHMNTKQQTSINRAMEELNSYLKEIAAAKLRLVQLDQEWQALFSRHYQTSKIAKPKAVLSETIRH